MQTLQYYKDNKSSFKVDDNNYKCPICGILKSNMGFIQHINKQHFIHDRGGKFTGGNNGHYKSEEFKLKVSHAIRTSLNRRLGNVVHETVKCFKCGKDISISRRENKPLKERYSCSQSCSNNFNNGYVFSEDATNRISKSISNLWKTNSEYSRRCLQSTTNKSVHFTSKNERLIREYFRSSFPEDEWTFGGCLSHDNVRLVRDLYSNKLKVNFEYDGIWHFENIHNQLEDKQIKDHALESWSIKHGWRLIRVSDSWFCSATNPLDIITKMVYHSNFPVLKFGVEFSISE